MSIAQLGPRLGRFDTILMLGNGFGLFGSPVLARRLLRGFLKMTNPGAKIIAESLDPYKPKDPFHLQYHKLNEKRGRMPGQIRIRIRYKKYSTPWFDYLLVSKEEMERIVDDTGWTVRRFISTGGQRVSSRGLAYLAIIQRT